MNSQYLHSEHGPLRGNKLALYINVGVFTFCIVGPRVGPTMKDHRTITSTGESLSDAVCAWEDTDTRKT